MTTRREFLIAGVGTVAASVAACGGGSSGSADASAPVSPPETSPPPPSSPPPPTVAGIEDPVLIYDGPGGITGTHLYAKLTPWRNPLGDWLDADGVPQGTRAFGETSVATNQTAPATIDVTALVALGGEPSLVLRGLAVGGSAPTMVFKSRESTSGPTLAITYKDGTTDLIPVMYDAECNTSTAYELGDRPTLTVGSSNAYLRFPAPTKAVALATLVLQIERIWQGGRLVVYKFALHRDPAPTETLTLKGDPRIFFETQCFAPGTTPKYIDAKVWDLYAATLGGAPDPYHQRAIVGDDEGGQALQITFDPRSNGAFNASVCFPNFDEAEEAAWEFDIRLMPDLLTGLADGVKLFAGCSSSTKNDDAAYVNYAGVPKAVGRMGTLLAGNGGSKSHGDDGWSHRWDLWNTPPAPHPLHGRFMPMQYTYWPGQADFYGDPWSWSLTHASLQVNEWYTITQRAKINTCVGTAWKADAEFDGYINHALALRKRGFYQRTTDVPLIALPPYNVQSKLAIGRIWLNTYHGGTALPLARCSFQVRNFRAAKFA